MQLWRNSALWVSALVSVPFIVARYGWMTAGRHFTYLLSPSQLGVSLQLLDCSPTAALCSAFSCGELFLKSS